MGTHSSSPSRLLDGTPLKEVLASAPSLIGDDVLNIFEVDDGNLPFLFKVLAIRKALSIQTHPDKRMAERLHAERPDVYKGALRHAQRPSTRFTHCIHISRRKPQARNGHCTHSVHRTLWIPAPSTDRHISHFNPRICIPTPRNCHFKLPRQLGLTHTPPERRRKMH